MQRRFEELDSLRGIAAVAVIFHHYLYLLPPICDQQRLPEFELITHTPLHIFWAGREAVLFFFVLSGFVLSLPFQDRKVPYGQFIAKRICRIYIPYLAAVCLAFGARHVFARGGIPELSSWFNSTWTDPITMRAAAEHFLLIGYFNNMQFDPVLWSLVHEMRISIIFPALMLMVTRAKWQTALAAGFVISGAAHFFTGHFHAFPIPEQDYIMTLHFIIMFVVGALMARHRWLLMERYARLAKPVKVALALLASVLYTYKWSVLPDVKLLHIYYFDDLMTTAGVCIFILTGLAAPSASRMLTAKPLVFTGRISYSIYLLHAILLLTFVNVLYGVAPLWTILPMTLVSTFGLSALMYKMVEEPSINVGRKLAASLPRQNRARATVAGGPRASGTY